MKRLSMLFFLGLLATGATGAIGAGQTRNEGTSAAAKAGIYDPGRDPQHDLSEAVIEASRSGKRILLDVGGEWCSWCHTLDAFFAKDPGLLDLREKNFVLLKVNVSRENDNHAFLSSYPKIPGYPHLFVLGPDGKLLHSQSTSELERGQGYNRDKVEAFLKKWAPAAK
jgi:thiol:disulfide interchange protein